MIYRFAGREESGNIKLAPVGYCRMVNGRPYGDLCPNWLVKAAAFAPKPMSEDYRRLLQRMMLDYIKRRAGELNAIPWEDDLHGVLDNIKNIESAAKSLIAAIDRSTPAVNYVINRMQQMDDIPYNDGTFSRDDFYPLLSQLVSRSHFLRRDLERENARGDALYLKQAWANFVHGAVHIYRQMGGEIRTPTLKSTTTARPSPFLNFAHTAMSAAPLELRQHTFRAGPANSDSEIGGFSA